MNCMSSVGKVTLILLIFCTALIISCAQYYFNFCDINVTKLTSNPGKWSKEEESQSKAANRDLKVSDIHFTIKTSGKLHQTRLEPILVTWVPAVAEHVYFFTDIDDYYLSFRTNNHVINTGCGANHDPEGLGCKLNKEYDSYMSSGKKWWCHFDDDNYVNVQQLLKLLDEFDWDKQVYLGKPSFPWKLHGRNITFGHGGNGFCVSRKLADDMAPWSQDGKLAQLCKQYHAGDDVILGFIITYKLKFDLTTSKLFHSHWEDKNTFEKIPTSELINQVSFSYSLSGKFAAKISDGFPSFSIEADPTRFLSIHCIRYPDWKPCALTHRKD